MSVLAIKGLQVLPYFKSADSIIEENATTRQDRFAESLKFIERSLSLSPTPSGHHHMALALARATPSQSIVCAIEHAKLAIEGQPSETRSWHLLSLLLMASGEWSKSMKIIEEGIKVSEQVFSHGSDDEGEKPDVTSTLNSRAKDFATRSRRIKEHPDKSVLEGSSDVLPPARTLIAPIPDPPPLTRRQEFEVALQLRLTFLAITEHAYGPEKASTGWLDLFTWFRERKAWVLDGGSGE
jgi:hypothetical protein